MPSELKLGDLIVYVVSQLRDMQASFGKTKLVKLLYLVDVEHYRLYSRKLTGLEWVFYHYGPYAFKIDQVLTQLDLDIPQEDVLTTTGHRAIVFRPSWNIQTEFMDQATLAEKSLVDRVLSKWGAEELNTVLSYAYFHTEPMKHASRGQVLDFSTIRQPSIECKSRITRRASETQADLLRELRDRFQKIRTDRSRQAPQHLTPEPRFDDIFWHAVTYLEIGERYSIPRGDIELAEDVKDQLRRETEFE